ncbi:hypothetical protein [Paenibacillus lutrae]|uniref:Uncharacterized protein n=1 Tax=Paenibacillus lutrae TaxID=2078573 RepID=A0A7X3FH70_9BACL|nr:hypothetical protein [Paenibacillus lutrae]MVO99537.1 hypothetical protein [Paenibacillus lutrae]
MTQLNSLKNRRIAQISFYMGIGMVVLFIVTNIILNNQEKDRDRLYIYDTPGISWKEYGINHTNIGIISTNTPDARFRVTRFPTFIITSGNNKEIKLITNEVNLLNEYLNKQ